MDQITICDLEVGWRVGVSEAERAQPQRLAVTLELGGDVSAAAARDELQATIDYQAVAARVRQFGEGRSWRLLETLASDLAAMILAEFRPDTVTVEVKKFVLPQTRYVAVRLTRRRIP